MRKVSILTPCYNSSSFISRLLDSVLEQSYPNIEMFVIDDGSTDNSLEIVQNYIPKFKSRSLSLECITQSNQGQGAAINNGLKLITGDYLIWPDSDDFFSRSDSIAKMVKVLNENKDISLVRCFTTILNEESLQQIGLLGGKKNNKNKKTNLFEDCLFVQNDFWFGAGNYMMRTDILDYYYTNRDMYPSNKYGGQNWQLLLPALYKKKCFTIEEYLYSILARSKSHSRKSFSKMDKLLLKYTEHEKILLKTLSYIKDMSQNELFNYKERIKLEYGIQRIIILLSYGDFVVAKGEYKKIRNNIKLKDKLKILIIYVATRFKSKK
ncbi:MAG: glycosyltransferase family 2 protein [Tissierellia bacterium]|nr:glycosyltransferase family 2 protein [Tissierellia bacterium]